MERELPLDIYHHNLLNRLSITEIIKLSLSNSFYKNLINQDRFWLTYLRKRIEAGETKLVVREIVEADSVRLVNLLITLTTDFRLCSLINYNSFKIVSAVLRNLNRGSDKTQLNGYIDCILSDFPNNLSEKSFKNLFSILRPYLKDNPEYFRKFVNHRYYSHNIKELLFLNDLGLISLRPTDLVRISSYFTPDFVKENRGLLREFLQRMTNSLAEEKSIGLVSETSTLSLL